MSSSKSKARVQQPPLVVEPLQAHKTTLIVLHGRGSTANKFAEPLLNHTVSTSPGSTSLSTAPPTAFRDYFPHTKFIFPTAALRRAKVFKRSLINQWFDNWSHTEPELKEQLQVDGLRETTAYLHGLLREEIEIVGAKNVVLMGLSQGCAASLIATLLWEDEPFGAVVGMCGYLPFRKRMLESTEAVEEEASHDDEDVFQRDEGDHRTGDSKFERAVNWLSEEIQLKSRGKSSESPPMRSIPVFMGHGEEDEKVPFESGESAAELLIDIGVRVEWKEYEGLGHWYSEDMLYHVVQFLKGLHGWGVDETIKP